MSRTRRTDNAAPIYYRTFLLCPGKRNQVLAPWEVRRYGLDSFGDADYVRLYEMLPADRGFSWLLGSS
jgi:hypothetical protein